MQATIQCQFHERGVSNHPLWGYCNHTIGKTADFWVFAPQIIYDTSIPRECSSDFSLIGDNPARLAA
jgi:hypothetical protein